MLWLTYANLCYVWHSRSAEFLLGLLAQEVYRRYRHLTESDEFGWFGCFFSEATNNSVTPLEEQKTTGKVCGFIKSRIVSVMLSAAHENRMCRTGDASISSKIQWFIIIIFTIKKLHYFRHPVHPMFGKLSVCVDGSPDNMHQHVPLQSQRINRLKNVQILPW